MPSGLRGRARDFDEPVCSRGDADAAPPGPAQARTSAAVASRSRWTAPSRRRCRASSTCCARPSAGRCCCRGRSRSTTAPTTAAAAASWSRRSDPARGRWSTLRARRGHLHLTGPLGAAVPGRRRPTRSASPAASASRRSCCWRARRARSGRDPVRLLFGGRTPSALAGIDDFAGLARVAAATDDGSYGFHGLVTALLAEQLARGKVRRGETVFCCGPDPMMHAVADLCAQRGCAASCQPRDLHGVRLRRLQRLLGAPCRASASRAGRTRRPASRARSTRRASW